MEITSKIDGDLSVLLLGGRIDAASSASLDHAVNAAIGGGIRHLVLDMSQVGYVSSAGLRSILLAAKNAKAAGGGVAVFGLQASVAEVFNGSGFGKILPIAADDAEARRKLVG